MSPRTGISYERIASCAGWQFRTRASRVSKQLEQYPSWKDNSYLATFITLFQQPRLLKVCQQRDIYTDFILASTQPREIWNISVLFWYPHRLRTPIMSTRFVLFARNDDSACNNSRFTFESDFIPGYVHKNSKRIHGALWPEKCL